MCHNSLSTSLNNYLNVSLKYRLVFWSCDAARLLLRAQMQVKINHSQMKCSAAVIVTESKSDGLLNTHI